jgi:PAS domain S-box-containing protein
VNPDGSAGGRIAAGVDITALRTTEMERRVEAERAQFRARMLDAVGQAVIATDLAGNVTYWNRAAEQLYGWTAAEAIGRKVVELTPTDASREQAAAIMDALQRGEPWSGEFEAKRKAGERFPALVTDAPILDDAGQLVGIVGISSDLTERRELERQLRQAQKMEAIGRLAGGIAHDFNNLLTAINGHSSMLLEDLPDDSPFRDDIRQILNAGDRAAALTRQLLAFSRKQVLEERAVDVCKLISDMQRLLRRLIPERIDLLIAMDDTPIVARADPDQLGQVVMNLLVNAGDAIEGAGRISIRVAAIELTPDMASAIPWAVHAGPYAQLLVEDTGAGMHPELLTHIFDPFFTTKPAGKGTGLGLSTVFGIVKQSGGHVLVESEPGRGSTFKVLLPLAQERPDEGIVDATPTAARPGGLVLLVEDEAAVRNLASRVLQRLGYRVLTAANGREALEIADAHGGRIDLVVTDVVMPELSGVELVDRLHERYPTIKVVLMSGYSEADLRGEVRTRGAFMVKPFTPDSLGRVVADALSA